MIYRDSVIKAQKLYYEMILKSGFPIKGLTPEDLEVADFGLSKGELDSFKRIGLGIYMLVNQTECGKVLCFHLAANTPQSVVAGPKGLVVIKFSLTSRDSPDIFTNPNIERITRIEERPG